MYEETSSQPRRGHEFWARVGQWLSEDFRMKRSVAFATILLGALVAFEIFNFSTTEFALSDLLGEARFLGIQWATILAIAFCGIDFAGLARLFTPERSRQESLEVWYLLGAWFLGATMNAMMTWWAVSLAMLDHAIGNEMLTRDELLTYIPLFVATLVWLTRILIIGTFSVAGERLFLQAEAITRFVQASSYSPAPGAQRPAVPRAAQAGRSAAGHSGPSAGAQIIGTPTGPPPRPAPELEYEDVEEGRPLLGRSPQPVARSAYAKQPAEPQKRAPRVRPAPTWRSDSPRERRHN